MTVPARYDWKKLEKFCSDVFVKAGVNQTSADMVADSLIQADLRGVESHGVVRTSIYLERIEKKMIDPKSKVEIESESEATALVNGKNNFGAVVGSFALDVAIKKAEEKGAGIVGVKGSNHFGTGAYYALRAVKEDMILLVMSNASQTMPPTGGIRPFIGTNPLAVGVPAGKEQPFILDMATSVVARGKIIVAAQKDQEIPEGWAIDKDGRPTTDAKEALEGSVLPIGGPKGYAISMFIDILSGVLTGAGFGKYVNNMYENWKDPQNVGHFFLAIDIKRFMPIEEFKSRMDLYIKEIKAEPKGEGVSEIYIPGEIEYLRANEYKKKGIQLPLKVAEELDGIGKRYGINLKDAAMTNDENTKGAVL